MLRRIDEPFEMQYHTQGDGRHDQAIAINNPLAADDRMAPEANAKQVARLIRAAEADDMMRLQ